MQQKFIDLDANKSWKWTDDDRYDWEDDNITNIKCEYAVLE